MPTKEHEITLDEFIFPKDLPDKRANFRFVIDLRYKDAKGKFAAETVVMPGLDTWWECDKKKTKKPNYVRHAAHAMFNMNLIDDWDKLVACNH